MDRLEQLRQVIDEIVRQNPDSEESRCGFVHLYGVSAICTLLALKRGLDPELCSVAGMLHDIWNYKAGENPDHGPLGAAEAEIVLNRLGTFSLAETEVVCRAIARHGDKQAIDGELDELVKDADVLQHYLYNPTLYSETLLRHDPVSRPARRRRLDRVLAELGLNQQMPGGST